MKKIIYCVECCKNIDAIFVKGDTVYPHRKDLHGLPFWQCDTCKNFVGCHHKSNDPTRPLGCIPNKELKSKRMQIHSILDPLWQNLGYNRNKIYKELSNLIGYEYHTAELKSVNEANIIIKFLKENYD